MAPFIITKARGSDSKLTMPTFRIILTTKAEMVREGNICNPQVDDDRVASMVVTEGLYDVFSSNFTVTETIEGEKGYSNTCKPRQKTSIPPNEERREPRYTRRTTT